MSQARHTVRDLFRGQRVPVSADLMDGILLIVSELVTNAVRHAALLSPLVGVQVVVTAGWVRIGVEDNHPYCPKALEAGHEATGGRGLLLVKAVSEEAGGACHVERSPSGGKVIWAEFPLAGSVDV